MLIPNAPSPANPITGISGQDGAYLAEFLLKKKYKVIGIERRSARSNNWRLQKLGIANKITIEDVKFAKLLGYRIKLISECSVIEGKIYASTKPKLISKTNPIANTEGALNAINIETDQLNNLFLEGEGAGGKPTASSVISDLYEILSKSNTTSLGFTSNKLKDYSKLDFLNILKYVDPKLF